MLLRGLVVSAATVSLSVLILSFSPPEDGVRIEGTFPGTKHVKGNERVVSDRCSIAVVTHISMSKFYVYSEQRVRFVQSRIKQPATPVAV